MADSDSDPLEKDPAPASAVPMKSVHTTTFPRDSRLSLGSSLGGDNLPGRQVVLLRPELGGPAPVLNTHFRAFDKPMGFAWEKGRFAIGTTTEVREFHDIPAVAPKLDEPGSAARHDAAFLPRNSHVTGDVQVHEMAWVRQQNVGGDLMMPALSELWFVNTRFSCLATRSPIYSFVPRWKPPFISALAPEDRCHLNGLCLREGRFATPRRSAKRIRPADGAPTNGPAES